jgi:hypothetical protein
MHTPPPSWVKLSLADHCWRGSFTPHHRHQGGTSARQKRADTVEKVDFFEWTEFFRRAGAFVRKLYGGTHE